MKEKFISFISKPRYIYLIYIFAAAASSVFKYLSGGHINNYLIFKNVYFNTIAENNLYAKYPELYFDNNHYGIFFSVLIAPFAVMPDWMGIVLWNIANVLVLIYAIEKLPFSAQQRAIFAWLCLQELITALAYSQFNIALTGLIILSACYIYRQKEIKSAAAILIGFFVKIYGIVGLSAFFFVKNKKKFILSLLVGAVVCFLLPMIFTSPQFVLQSYSDWIEALQFKNNKNQFGDEGRQDISLMGFVRRITGHHEISNLTFLAFGLPIFGLPYLRIKWYQNRAFQLLILASTLLFTVLFSSGSESPTYIIAVAGVMIWYVIQKEKTLFVNFLLVFVIIFTCFSTSDLFPRSFKVNYIIAYALKAVPCVIVWFRIIWELMFFDFKEDYIIHEK